MSEKEKCGKLNFEGSKCRGREVGGSGWVREGGRRPFISEKQKIYDSNQERVEYIDANLISLT